MAATPAGLKAGLEVHQQLETREKLFCRCPPRLREPSEKTVEFLRILRPTAGEAGEVDAAAREESRRGRRFRYLGYDTTCLVECDEEPPRELNPEALEVALQVALLLDMEPVDEVHVMRKVVIDGSNTTGFQRTALVATGGRIDTSSGPVGLTTLCLEEDAAAIVGQEGDTVVYSLDRLGIPLVEIATGADLRSPAQAREAARHIGMVLRSTGKVKRGLGTVRQDVNVSIAGGARVEVKGVQQLDLVEKVVASEAGRQARLLELQKALPQSSVSARDSSMRLEGWRPWEPVVGIDLQAIAIQYGCQLAGEPSGGDLVYQIRPRPGSGPRVDEVGRLLADRARLLLSRVPEETRRALEDGTTEYLRPLPGAARMYPETDVRTVALPPALLRRIRANLPELLEVRQRKLRERYGLNDELAAAALERADLFEAWAASAPAVPASGVVRALGALERLEPLPATLTLDLARDVPALLVHLNSLRASTSPAEWGQRYQPAQAELERLLPVLRGGSDAEARAVVERVVREKAAFVRERGEGAHGPLMGLAMKELRGRADGALVARLLKERMEALLRS